MQAGYAIMKQVNVLTVLKGLNKYELSFLWMADG